MVFLLLAILCGSTLSIVMRFSEGKIRSSIAMIAANYLTCIVMATCFLGPEKLFSSAPGLECTLGLGMLNGIFYMSALICTQFNIRRNGVVLPSVFSKTGALLVPLAVSICFFGETPSIFQGAGAVLAAAAILLMNYRRDGGSASSLGFLFLLLFTEGMASSMSKVYREVGNAALSDHFLLFTFGSAFLLCVGVLLLRRERPGLNELLFGMMIGIPNFLGARCVLAALRGLPAIIVYPSRSVLSLALITLAGVFLFRERLSKRQKIAMLLVFAALVLLNI